MKILFLAPVNDHTSKIKDFLTLEGAIIIQQDSEIYFDVLFEMGIDWIISYGYRYIIPPDIINNYKNRIINLHISFLPWNKGADPNFWGWFENTPKGVTIHQIDSDIDTGDILVQKEIDEEIWKQNETLKTTYEKLHRTIVYMFISHWDMIKKDHLHPKKQAEKIGSIHYKNDLNKYSFLLDKYGWDTPVKLIQDYGRKVNA